MIKQVHIRNFKNVKQVDLDLVAGVYLITGENNVGKSHLIEAIIMGFTGERAGEILSQGATDGEVVTKYEINGKDYEFNLKYSEKNPRGTLKITDLETGMFSDKLGFLHSLCQHTDFDANEFLRWSETADGRRKQVETVKLLLAPEVRQKAAELAQEITNIQQLRTSLNVQLANNQVNYQEALTATDGLYIEALAAKGEINPVEQTQALQALLKKEAAKEAAETLLANLKSEAAGWDGMTAELTKVYDADIKAADDAVLELERQLLEAKSKQRAKTQAKKDGLDNRITAKAELQKRNENGAAVVKTYDGLADQVEVIKNALETSTKHNQDFSKVITLKQRTEQLNVTTAAYQVKTKELEEKTAARKALITSADMPVNGLTFDEDGLYLNGLPFNFATVSTSDMTQVACALQIASNKKTGVFKILNGQDLGTEKMAGIIAFAKENKLQGFIEEVRRGKEMLTVELIENA